MTIVAANLKTESGDSYLYLFKSVSSPEDFVSKVEAELGEELAYVYDFDIESDGDTEKFVDVLTDYIDKLEQGE